MSIAEKLIAVAENAQRVWDSGYSQGYEEGRSTGGGGGNSGIFMAKVTPSVDDDYLVITHNLGTSDILFAACFMETLGDFQPTFNLSLSKFWAKSDIVNQRGGTGFNTGYYWQTTNSYAVGTQPMSVSNWDMTDGANRFVFFKAGASASKFVAGVTYTIIIMAESAFKE